MDCFWGFKISPQLIDLKNKIFFFRDVVCALRKSFEYLNMNILHLQFYQLIKMKCFFISMNTVKQKLTWYRYVVICGEMKRTDSYSALFFSPSSVPLIRPVSYLSFHFLLIYLKCQLCIRPFQGSGGNSILGSCKPC